MAFPLLIFPKKVIPIISSADDRRNQIVIMLKEKKKIKVAELKSIFGVSGVTIGTDLNHLEKMGLIEKSFGYAIFKANSSVFYSEEDTDNFDAKKRIAKEAVKLIESNESVMLYSGSTVLQVARNIIGMKNLIAVTNSTQIAHELGNKPYINTILLGGFYNPSNFSCYGEQAIKQFSEYNIDKVILSANGISSQDGITIDQPFEFELNKIVIKNAKTKIVVADYTKIGLSRFIKIGPVSDIDILITDEKAPEAEIENIRKMGVKVILA